MSRSSSNTPTTGPKPHERRHVLLGLVLAASLLLNAVPLWWGLPSDSVETWSFDEIPPDARGLTALSRHQGRYPPLHYYLLLALYAPARALDAASILGLDPRELRTLLQVLGRSLSVLLATATIYMVYRIGRLVLRPAAAVLAAPTAAMSVPFVFYAKTTNLESPYLFWFSVSVFFFVRARQSLRLRDFLVFAATAILAMCTKDQAYGLYVLPSFLLLAAVHRDRYPQGASAGAWLRTLADRRLVLSVLLAVGLFALIHGLPFRWEEFSTHLRVLTGRASIPWRTYEHTVPSHLQMTVQAARHVAFCMGWPMLSLAVLGLGSALRHRNRPLLTLLAFPLSYYLFFVVPILYHYVRFFLPVAMILALFAGEALGLLLESRGRRWQWGRWMAAAAVLLTLARPVSLDLEMLFDSRYYIEAWLDAQTDSEPTKVAMLGRNSQPLPRGHGLHDLSRAAARGLPYLRELDADLLVLNEEEPMSDQQRRFVDRLVAGQLNYRVALRQRWQPWGYRLNREGIHTNLRTVNPQITVLRKVAPWGPSDAEIHQTLRSLRNEADGEAWRRLADVIMTGPPSPERRSIGSDTLAFGLSSDGWTRGTSAAAIVIENPGQAPIRPTLRLRCGAAAENLPLTAFVQTAESLDRVVFDQAGAKRVVLSPVPPDGRRLYLVYTDREWTPPGQSRRKLGVHVRRSRNRR